MKLVEILARELKEWPEGNERLSQFGNRCVLIFEKDWHAYAFTMSEDWRTAEVTRAQWEAERARIAANKQATKEAREIVRTGSMTSEEQEIADIACGKRSKEDQELWDKVAITALAKSISTYPDDSTKEQASYCFEYADAFMAERAKRMKG